MIYIATFQVCGLEHASQISCQTQLSLEYNVHGKTILITVVLAGQQIKIVDFSRKVVGDDVSYQCGLREWSFLKQMLRQIVVEESPVLNIKDVEIEFEFFGQGKQ